MSSMEKIASLLAKAERTDNEHEASAYLAKAQHLATMAAIDLEVARSHVSSSAAREVPVARTVTIGERGKRANKHLVSLFITVASANDVKIDVSHYSTYVIGYGMPSDLDVVQAIWASVAQQMVAAAGAYLKVGSWRDEKYYSMRSYEYKPHTAQTARAAFYQGYISRIGARLRAARAEAVDHADKAGGDDRDSASLNGDGSAALVLKRKSDEVAAFHQATSKARGSWSGYRGGGAYDGGAANRAGREAGDRARLGAPKKLGERGRLPEAG